MYKPANIPIGWTPSPSPQRSLMQEVVRTSDQASPNQQILPFSITSATTSNNADGVYMTWKDLEVTVFDKKTRKRRAIIDGVTGYAQPGEVLAIMGPSGSGKSTLLDALAGRLGSDTVQNGEILINGRRQVLAFGTSAYVTQDDTLTTTLTVKEAVYYSAQLQLPDSMSKSAKKERAETTIKEMGLENCMNTRIGGWTKKGLSGGQKRRVSICIEILTRPKLLFLDEPTSGLDSAAAYHVMSRIVDLARRDGRTVVASIHQPSGEVFELFQNLCLLSSGSLVYFGPAPLAKEFFESNGFPCPILRSPCDHYLRTINKDFDVDIEQGYGNKTISTEGAITILLQSYKSSQACEYVKQRVYELCQQKGRTLEKKGGQAGFVTQCFVLTRRSFVNMYRDLGYYWFRLGIYIGLGITMGSIFFDMNSSYGSIQAKGALLMFVSALLTFMAIGGFPSFVEDMKIFSRERLNGHYGVTSFVIGNTLSSIPFLLINSLLPAVVVYCLAHLRSGSEHLIYFALVLFMSTMLVESLMMVVASIVPDFLMGIIVGAGIQGVMMLTGGFFRLPHELPKPFWKFPLYYISFAKYAYQGLSKNEFSGTVYPSHLGGGKTISGDEILKDYWQMETGYSKWVDLGILLGMTILYRLIFLGVNKITEKTRPTIKASIANKSTQTNQVAVDEEKTKM